MKEVVWEMNENEHVLKSIKQRNIDEYVKLGMWPLCKQVSNVPY